MYEIGISIFNTIQFLYFKVFPSMRTITQTREKVFYFNRVLSLILVIFE